MADFLNHICSEEDLRKHEKKFNAEVVQGKLSNSTKFDYACFLVRSKYPADIQRGISLLEELYQDKNESGKRDYVFFLAVGNARLKNYQDSLNYLNGILRIEPNNRQVKELHELVKKEMKNDAMKGAAIAGGAVLIGGLAVLGLALSRSK